MDTAQKQHQFHAAAKENEVQSWETCPTSVPNSDPNPCVRCRRSQHGQDAGFSSWCGSELGSPPSSLDTGLSCLTEPASHPAWRSCQAAHSNPKLVLDMNHSTSGSCLCVQLVICAILLHQAATRHCREKRRHQGCTAERTAPCLSFPAWKSRDRRMPYAG